MTQSLNTKGLTVMMLNLFFNDRSLPTLCAQAAGAVVRGQRHPVAQPAAVFGLRSRALSAALPLAVRTTRRPLAPLAPAAVHCGNQIKSCKPRIRDLMMHVRKKEAKKYIIINK